MPTRDEVLGSLSKLVTDKSKLDRFAQALDKQADIAKELELSQKQEGETPVSTPQTDLRKELEQVLETVFPVIKSLQERLDKAEAQLKTLTGQAIEAAQDTPSASLGAWAQKYFQSAGAQQNAQQPQTQMPDPTQFQRPTENKGADTGALPFGMGVFNDLLAGKYDVPAKK